MNVNKSMKVYLEMGYPISQAKHKAKNQINHAHKVQKKEGK